MFMKTNILIRISRCSVKMKTALFKRFCLCLYDTALWNNFSMCTMNKLKSAYNKCIKICIGYKRDYSVTEMLYEPNLPNLATVLYNGATTFTSMCYAYPNSIITHLLCVIS